MCAQVHPGCTLTTQKYIVSPLAQFPLKSGVLVKLANDPAERFGTSNARFIEFIRCVKTCFLNNAFRSNVVVDP